MKDKFFLKNSNEMVRDNDNIGLDLKYYSKINYY